MRLSCEHMTKVYCGKKVLKDISLTLESGKIYGLLGPHGAGKTTLLSVMTGQNPATEGKILLDGVPIWENRSALEQICWIRRFSKELQSGVSNIKVREYLYTASCCYPQWNKTKEKELADTFQLDGSRRIGRLSDEKRSLLAILTSMCSQAEFTFMDEPTFGLDTAAYRKFCQILQEERKSSNRTFIITTRQPKKFMGVLEEGIVLKDGALLPVCGLHELEKTLHSIENDPE